MDNNTLNLFQEVYFRNADKLLYFARKFVDKSTAEDIVQDAFLKIWMKNTDLSLKEVNSYLYTMVRNGCLDHIKHTAVENNYKSKLIEEVQRLEIEYYKDPSDILIDRESKIFINKIVGILPEKCQRIFRMAYFEEKPYADIASELDLSLRTVENQVYKAMKMIRTLILSQKNIKEDE